jgi:pimeloyl-ACP methyl ester carboxylesterase
MPNILDVDTDRSRSAELDRTGRLTESANGRRLCFAEWGDIDGRPVISMHGVPGCRLPSPTEVEHGLDEVIRELGIRLITYDRPGYCESDRQPGRTIADSATDVATVADAVGCERFAVVGTSGGGPHALAAAAFLPTRVVRAATVAPMAPLSELGLASWTAGQDPGVIEYVGWVLEGEVRMAEAFAREDELEKGGASPDDARTAATFEQTRHGLGGWIDDEVAAMGPWGFDPGAIRVPTAIWYDPMETILPRQHAEWLAARIPSAQLVQTDALGHGSTGDRASAWARLYGWLVETL